MSTHFISVSQCLPTYNVKEMFFFELQKQTKAKAVYLVELKHPLVRCISKLIAVAAISLPAMWGLFLAEQGPRTGQMYCCINMEDIEH